MIKPNYDKKCLLAECIEVFEDFLMSKGIEIESSIQEMLEDANHEDNSAVIYGTDYYALESDLEEVMIAHGVFEKEMHEDTNKD